MGCGIGGDGCRVRRLPPDEEGRAEDDGGEEALVDTSDAVGFILESRKY